MAQRYTDVLALDRMAHDLCPECGVASVMHSMDHRFWLRAGCDLTPAGVEARIGQYQIETTSTKET